MEFGCRHVESAKTVLSTEIDNNDYELVNKQIVVQGVGESRNQQQSYNKSRAAALDSAAAILREVVQAVAEERGFTVPSMKELLFANTRALDQKTTARNNEKGVRIYRSQQTLSVEVESPLRMIFEKLEINENYGWPMFLRDIDRYFDIKINKND